MREAMAKHRAKVASKAPVLLTAPLQSGATIPLLGLGTWKAKPGEVRAAVLYAITCAGYRHIDCAAIYENEGEVGSALEEVFSNWDIKREEIFITTKLWNNDHAAGRVEPALRKCLKLLKLDYCDAFLIHWPITGNRGDTVQPPTRETWEAMEACQKLGLARHIGVSNFSTVKLRDIMSYATVPISIVQCESHPLWRNDEVVRFCEENRIHFTAFSPLVRTQVLCGRRIMQLTSRFSSGLARQRGHLPPRGSGADGRAHCARHRRAHRQERGPGADQVGAAAPPAQLRAAQEHEREPHPGQRRRA
jgi:diketogulonate reductase-like aldo/keto reductase